MKNSRFALFITGLIVFLAGGTFFILNYELWLSSTISWVTTGALIVGSFLIGMAANNNQAGYIHSMSDLKSDSFKIIMFRQSASNSQSWIEMLIQLPENSYKGNFYVSVGADKFIDSPMKDTWYIYRNYKILQDLTKSPIQQEAAS